MRCVPTGETSSVCETDVAQNQMQEALMLFESICNSQWFIKTSIILFLNKIDLFKQKLPASPVKRYFPDYTGDPSSYKQASEFFQENFRRLNRNPQKVVHRRPVKVVLERGGAD